MARVELTLPQSCVDYIAEIEPQVHFKPLSILESATTFLGKLGNVAWLNVSNACNVVSMAKRFEHEMANIDKDREELSYELSFLSEATISKLEIPVSQRNLDIVNMAILLTLCAHKQIALINHARALRLQLTRNPDTDASTEPNRPISMTVEQGTAPVAAPTERHDIVALTSASSDYFDHDIDFTVPDLF